MEPVELSNGDLTLRPWCPTDAEAVHRACQDPEIQRWTTVPNPYLPEHARQWVAEASPRRWADGTAASFGVFDTASGTLLGSNGLVTIDHRLGSGEIGYWTAPWARGRGVTVRGIRAVARWAFRSLGLRRLTWLAVLGNHPSRLAALRAGFHIEGRIRLADPPPFGPGVGWIGSMLPEDLDGPPRELDPLLVRRAKVFGGEQPTLSLDAGGQPLTLRPPTSRDIDPIVATCRDPEAIRWTMVPYPYRRVDAESFIRRGRERWAGGEAAIYGLYDRSGTYCGSFDLRLSATDPGIADVGYLVSPWARGHGYATAAVRALCGWGFGHLTLTRVEWRACVGNEASRRVAEKAGFQMEGTERAGLAHRGERRDCWIGAVLRSDAI
jgi:RimJ/RimL family protein N-acetyltransferase